MPENRTALIVGANRGIGLGVAKAFQGRGWQVVGTARNPEAATELRGLGVEVLALDVNEPAALEAFPAALAGRTLDAVLLNAGVAGPAHRSASAATAGEIGALMFTNAIAPIRLARALAPLLRPGAGVVAFTSSVMGSVSQNPGGHELYRASKAALNSLAQGLWGELRGRNLTMVTLHPGWVATDMGGASAPVSVADSAAGIVRVIETEAGKHRHRFLDYTGKELPW
jgi:NAD(P)-dependent dehydrogenase (short-subunit alcohol dehydrogenase family)